MMIWFTADTHFGHANIIKYCNRPFKSASEMDETIITNWNAMVAPSDTVYHLGDFTLSGRDAFVSYAKRLNGTIRIVPGGHDHRWLSAPAPVPALSYTLQRVEVLPPLFTLVLDENVVVLCHYAMRVWDRSHYGSWHLYGHNHGTLPEWGLSFDVGVDSHHFQPVSLREVSERFKTMVAIKDVRHP